MKKLQHTPGPWKIGTPPPNGEQTIGVNNGLMIAISTTGDNIDSKANARLIAAAPDMLKELISFCAYNCTDCPGKTEGCSKTCGLKNAKEIIEKATGLTIEEVLSE